MFSSVFKITYKVAIRNLFPVRLSNFQLPSIISSVALYQLSESILLKYIDTMDAIYLRSWALRKEKIIRKTNVENVKLRLPTKQNKQTNFHANYTILEMCCHWLLYKLPWNNIVGYLRKK